MAADLTKDEQLQLVSLARKGGWTDVQIAEKALAEPIEALLAVLPAEAVAAALVTAAEQARARGRTRH